MDEPNESEATGTEQSGSPANPSPQDVMASLQASVPPATSVRESPEYQELQRQNRELARREGTVRAENERMRQERDQERQAAEARRVEEQTRIMRDTLGESAPAFSELATLMQTDPVAAARRFSEWQASAQSQPAPPPPPQPASAPTSGGSSFVPAQQGRERGLQVDAGQPLGVPPQQTKDETVAGYRKRFEDTAALNRDPRTRGQVRARERAVALENYMRGEYLDTHDLDPTIDFSRSR